MAYSIALKGCFGGEMCTSGPALAPLEGPGSRAEACAQGGAAAWHLDQVHSDAGLDSSTLLDIFSCCGHVETAGF